MSDVAPNPLVVEIASHLASHGHFVTYLEQGRLQDVVDIGWAARQAGQLLGRQVHVSTTRSEELGGRLMVVAEMTVTDRAHDDDPDADPGHGSGHQRGVSTTTD